MGKHEYENEQIKDNEISMNSTSGNIYSANLECCPIVDLTKNDELVKQEKPNAFHVLMPHIKPLKHCSIEQSTGDRIFVHNHKDKLNTISGKKTNSKKKSSGNGDQERDKVKKEIPNRSKVSKYASAKEYTKTNSLSSNEKIYVNNLHEYFNKMTPKKLEDRSLSSRSTMLVESNISERNFEELSTPLHSKTEGLNHLEIEAMTSETISKELLYIQRKKPKWSLRMNLEISNESFNKIDEMRHHTNDRVENKMKETRDKINTNNSLTPEVNNSNAIHTEQDMINTSILSNERCNISEKYIYEGKSEIHMDDEIIEMKNLKRPIKDNLAPLFIKKLKPHPNVPETKDSFFDSELSTHFKRFTESTSRSSISTISLFPSISHVTQLNIDVEICNLQYNSTYPVKVCFENMQFDSTDLKYVIEFTDTVVQNSTFVPNRTEFNIEKTLKEIEKRCIDARKIWKKILMVTNQSNIQLSPKGRGSMKKSLDGSLNSSRLIDNNHIETWTQKYRPLSSKEVTSNEEAVLKLRNWLRSWKVSTNKDNDSSGDEFHNSENSCKNSSEYNKVAVIIGPYGSGKTASIYAIAEELHYNVLELNASNKRPGKKILKELEEATKSHRVKKLDMKITTGSSFDTNNETKNSLILIEDVDLIFDDDEGFISAIHQLASNSKRPIAMTSRNVCSYLNRIAPQQLQICFQKVSGTKVVALMELITLAETGVPIPRIYLEKLIARGDLRNALLKLQYLSLSGISVETALSQNFQETLWQDIRNYLYRPIIKIDKEKVEDDKNEIKLCVMKILADDLDTIAFVSSLIEINDDALEISGINIEPSLSLEENSDSYSQNIVQSIEISKWLTKKIMRRNISDIDQNNTKILNQLLTKKETTKNINLALSQVTNYTINNEILSSDYLPIVRSICRIEDLKANNKLKRGNRFFHYLQNFRLPSNFIKSNVLSTVCKSMQEKMETSHE